MVKTKCIIKKPTIRDRDLSKENVLGFAYPDCFEIEIERNQSDKEYQNTLIHEVFHCILPDLTERSVIKFADILSDILWKRGYRTRVKRKKNK